MATVEVFINGEKKTELGIDEEYFVLSSNIVWVKRETDQKEELFIETGALDSKTKSYYRCPNHSFSPGDIITIKIGDEPLDKSQNIKQILSSDDEYVKERLKYYYQLQEELKEFL